MYHLNPEITFCLRLSQTSYLILEITIGLHLSASREQHITKTVSYYAKSIWNDPVSYHVSQYLRYLCSCSVGHQLLYASSGELDRYGLPS